MLTQRTTERRGEDHPTPYTSEEVWSLTRHAGGTWSARNVSRSPETPSGGDNGGTPPGQATLALGSGGTLHALFGELRRGGFDPDGELGEIRYATWRLGSEAWNPPQTVYDVPPVRPNALSGAALPADMASDGTGTLHAALKLDDGSPFGAAATMTLRGGTWSDPQVVAESGPDGSNTRSPRLASGRDGSLLLIYLELRDGPNSVHFRRSTDGGQVWTSPEVVFQTVEGTEQIYSPRVIEGDETGTYHVFFARVVGSDDFPDQVWHSYYTEARGTWTPPAPVSPQTSGFVDDIQVARDGSGNVHLFYTWEPNFGSAGSNEDFGHRVWNGTGWEDRPQLSQNSVTGGDFALTAGPQGCLHVAWEEGTAAEDIDGDGRQESTEQRLRYRRIESTCGG